MKRIHKLHKKLQKFFSSPEHIRSVSMIVLLIVITAIPLTEYVLQKPQDNRSRATVGGGFNAVDTNGCGEAVSKPADGANEGEITYIAPVYENGQWVLHKADGTTVTQADMRTAYINDGRNGSTISERTAAWDTGGVVSQYQINCNVFVTFHGVDCNILSIDGLVDKIDSDGKWYSAMPMGGTATMHIQSGVDTSGQRCRYNFKVRADLDGRGGGATDTPEPTVAPTCTDSDGGLIYDTAGVVNGSDTNGTSFSYADTCKTASTVAEMACSKNHDYAFGVYKNCPNGCSNGACINRTGVPLATGTLCDTDSDCASGESCSNATVCVSDGVSLLPVGTITPTPTTDVTDTPAVAATATVTPTPSNTPTPTQTPTPTLTPTPSNTPTPSMTPTPTQPKTPTIFSISLAVPGIGQNGNPTPNNASKHVLVQIFSGTQKIGADLNGTVSFEGGVFKGNINAGTILVKGSYSVKVKLDQALAKTIATNIVVNIGATNTIVQATVVNGDINNDNKLDILDYNILASCFGGKSNSDTCAGKQVDSDLNDDGVVDGVDYNLLLLGIKTAKQGD